MSKSAPNRNRWFLFLFTSILILLANLAFLVWAGYFLDTNYSHLPPLPDLVLEALPRWDVRFLIQTGLLTSLTLFIVGSWNELPRMPYIFFIAGFWFFIRTISMVVTPLGIPADILPVYPENFYDTQTFWGLVSGSLASPSVLFFSGHTGLPFLGFLIFRKSIRCWSLSFPMLLLSVIYFVSSDLYSSWGWYVLGLGWLLVFFNWQRVISLRYVFLAWSSVMASAVLLTRVHYTIDVLAAYFMTAGIYFIGRRLFAKTEFFYEKIE